MIRLLPLLYALILTLLTETAIALFIGTKKKQLAVVVLMNIMTNPAANVLYSFLLTYTALPKTAATLMLEAAIIVTEAVCCRGIIKTPWRFSIACNTCSYLIGLILQIIM